MRCFVAGACDRRRVDLRSEAPGSLKGTGRSAPGTRIAAHKQFRNSIKAVSDHLGSQISAFRLLVPPITVRALGGLSLLGSGA